MFSRLQKIRRKEKRHIMQHRRIQRNTDTLVYVATRQADGSWIFTWTAGASPWRVFLDGKQIDTVTTTATYTFLQDGYQDSPPPLEIVGAGQDAETELYPAWVTLQWRESATAVSYVVKELISGSYVEVNNQPDTDSGYYSFETPSLTDATEATWRVYGIDSGLREGSPLSFTFTINRNPPEPDVTYSVSGGTLTIGAA